MSTPNSSLSRRERERRRRRRAMLKAAQSVFAEKGYAHATLDEIAERAEFGKGTLYNYFENGKEGLLFAIFDAVYDDLHEMIVSTFGEGASSSDSFRASFHELVVRSYTYYEEREDLFLILIKEGHRLCFSNDPDKAAYFRRQQQRMLDALAPAAETAMQNGAIATLPPQSVAHMLLEVVHDLVVHRCLAEWDDEDAPACRCTTDTSLLHEPEAAADFLTSLLFDGLARNGAPSAEA